jgi:lysophospholipase L1-like esterase
MKRLVPLAALASIAIAVPAEAPAAHRGRSGHWVGAWSTPPIRPGLLAGAIPFNAGTGGRTVRNIVHTTLGGTAVRIRLSNVFGTRPLKIDDARLAISAGRGLLRGRVRRVRFGGRARVTVPVGRQVTSDPLAMRVRFGEDIAVSLYSAGAIGDATTGGSLFHTNYVSEPGDHGADRSARSYTTTAKVWYYLAGVDVKASRRSAGAVVALGDSITQGYSSTPDANRGWVDLLARRLHAARPRLGRSFLNAGIAGNNLHQDTPCFGQSALHRLTRDALDQTGVGTVIVDEGANDLSHPIEPPTDPLYGCVAHRKASAAAMIRLYRRGMRRIHGRHLKAIIATITPFGRYRYWTPAIERKRRAINHWIRTNRSADGFIDLDRVLKSPAHPSWLRVAYDSGDHLHPNDAGHAAIARSIKLSLF